MLSEAYGSLPRVCVCVCVCVCMFVTTVFALHAGFRSKQVCKTMFSWIEILQIFLKVFDSRVMAVFEGSPDCCEVSRTLHRKLLTAKRRYIVSYLDLMYGAR